MARLLVTMLCSLAPAGCGRSRMPVPALAVPRAPAPARTRDYPAAGVRLRAPANWVATPAAAPAVATISSGAALVTVYRYPRAEPLPGTRSALAAALPGLVAAARARDRTLALTRRTATRIAGAPALVLLGTETLGGVRRGVRSVHVFAHGAEVVLDALAPAAAFPGLDASVFRPLAASLRPSAPGA